MKVFDLTTTALAGEVYDFTFAFASALASGETISSVAGNMAINPYSRVADSNATNLLLGSPSVSGSNVIAFAGGLGTTGFQPGAVYSLVITATTSLGQTLRSWGNISTLALTPPAASSSGSVPSNEFNVTMSLTPAAPGYYYVKTTGVTITPPAASVGGDIVVVNDTGSDSAGIVVGATINYPAGLTIQSKGQSIRMRWSNLNPGMFII